jgi:hypothetical protein
VQRLVNIGPAYTVENGLIRFNTGSTLPDNARVTSAGLSLAVIFSRDVEGGSLMGEWYDWGPTVGPEDYSETAASTAFSLPLLSIPIAGNISVPLTAPDVNVNLTGYTYLRTHISHLPEDPPPLGLNLVQFALFDYSGAPGPALQVCYDYSPPVPTTTPTQTSTPTQTQTPLYGQTSVIFATGVCCTSAVGTDCEDRSPATPGTQYRVCNVPANCTNPTYPVCAGDSLDDGYTESEFSATYPPPFGRCVMHTGNTFASRVLNGTYRVRNALVQFNAASTLPDDAVIDSAVLRLHASAIGSPNNLNFEGEWYDWGGVCDASDYTTTSASTAFSVPIAAIPAQTDFDIPLTSPSNVKVAGTVATRLRFHVSNLPGDAPPTGVNTFPLASYNADLSIEPGPRLIVVYHLPTPTTTPTATETPAGPTPTETPVTPPQATVTATSTPTATPTPTATCLVFRTGMCCADATGTSCAATACNADTGCQVYPFLVCAGANADDGQVGRLGSSVYPPTTATTVDAGAISADTRRSASSALYVVQNGLMRFNTASLPDNASVLRATLLALLVAPPQSADGLNLTGEWFNWGSSIGAEDFSETAASSAFSVPISALVNGDNAIPLASPASNVSLTGYTYLRTHISQLPGDAPPTGANVVKIGQFDAPTDPGPALQVCYTVGP